MNPIIPPTHHPKFKEIFLDSFNSKLSEGLGRAEAASIALLHAKECVIALINSSIPKTPDSITPEKSNECDHSTSPAIESAIPQGISPIYSDNNTQSDQNTIEKLDNSLSKTPVSNNSYYRVQHLNTPSLQSINLSSEYEDFNNKRANDETQFSENFINESFSQGIIGLTPDINGTSMNGELSFGMDEVYNNNSLLSANINPAAETLTLRMESIYDDEFIAFNDNPSLKPASSQPRVISTNPATNRRIEDEDEDMILLPSSSNDMILQTPTVLESTTIVNRNISIVSDSTLTPESPSPYDDDSLDSKLLEVIIDLKIDKPSEQYKEKLIILPEKFFVSEPESKEEKEIDSGSTQQLANQTLIVTPVKENHFRDTESKVVSFSRDDEVPGDDDWAVIMSASRKKASEQTESSEVHSPFVDKNIAPSSTCFCM